MIFQINSMILLSLKGTRLTEIFSTYSLHPVLVEHTQPSVEMEFNTKHITTFNSRFNERMVLLARHFKQWYIQYKQRYYGLYPLGKSCCLLIVRLLLFLLYSDLSFELYYDGLYGIPFQWYTHLRLTNGYMRMKSCTIK